MLGGLPGAAEGVEVLGAVHRRPVPQEATLHHQDLLQGRDHLLYRRRHSYRGSHGQGFKALDSTGSLTGWTPLNLSAYWEAPPAL